MSAFDLISSFFTPTYLFLFLNLIIGTIFLTSRHRPPKPQPQPPAPLARSPSSLIDRVRSINWSLYKFDSHPEPTPAQHYYPGPVREVDDGSPPPPPLARAPSLLDRLRSVDFYQRKFEHVNPEPEHEPLQRVDPPAAPLSRTPSSLLDRLNFYYQKFDQPADPVGEIGRDAAPPLARAPSLLGRVRSIKFPSFYDTHPDAEPDHHDGDRQGKDTGHGPVRRIRSESERMVGEEGQKPRIRKTASERSAAAEEENVAAVAGEEEINAKADDFIQRFRQQLKLQRLDSIMRYKDMLTGGGR